MLRKLLAALSVALVALLFTSPTALATEEDNTNNVAYWQNYYGGGTVCYKDDSSKGTVSGKTVTLKDNGWTHLIVKGGSVDTGSGPGNVIYDNPSKNTPYAAPNNSGGQPSDVSHWIVCGPAPFDWNWKYEAPTCTALVVVYPEDIPAGQANDVNVKIKNLITDEFVTLNFHKGDGTWSGTKTFTFADASNWPGWDYYAVTWVQVAGTNYHWEGKITCGNPPPVDVCKNLDGNQAEVPEGYTEDDGECTHPPVDVCINYEKVSLDWDDYVGNEEQYTLYNSETCTPPVQYCANLDGKTIAWAQDHGYFIDEDWNCFKKVYVCKYVTTPGGTEILQTGNNPISVSVNTLKDFPGTLPWEFVDAQGKSIAFAWAVPGTPQDEEPGLENCPQPPPVDVCIDYAKVSIPAAQYAGHEDEYVLFDALTCHAPVKVCIDYQKVWIPWSQYFGHEEQYTLYDKETCHPPVDVCKNLDGFQGEVPEGWTEEDGYCFHEEVVCWLMDNYEGGATEPGSTVPEMFPQTRIDCEEEIPCGMWVQVDLYHIASWHQEQVFLNLGDELSWTPYGPEDMAIYKDHIFVYGGDCPPPPPYCTIGDVKYYEGDVLPTGYVWTGQGACTPPPPPMCKNLEMTVADAIEKGYFYDEETGDCFKKVYVCKYVTTPGGHEVLQTGNNPIAVSVNALKDKDNPDNVFAGVFPFTFADEHGKSIAFAWAVPGTPQDEEPGLEDCPQPPKVKVCEYDSETGAHAVEYAPEALPEDYILWEDGSECTPNIDASLIQPLCVDGAPYLHIDVNLFDPADVSTDDGTVDLLFKKGSFEKWVYDVPLDPSDLTADFLWPGASVDSFGVPNGWPGWALIDGLWQNVGNDNDGWTREGATLTVYFNPEKTFDITYPPESAECVVPPPVQVCEYTDGDTTGHMVEYAAGTAPENFIPWVDGSECVPDVCPNIQGDQPEIPDGMAFYPDGEGEKCATPPNLDGTLFASQCVDDVPWVVYDVNLVDPQGVSTDDGTATFTFTAAGHPGLSYVKTVPIGSGQFLWPGATATANGDGTYTATGWPGWALVDGEWVSTGDENFGWTRDGVSVKIEVNPEMTVNLTYPPPTALCVAGPPTEIDNELDAPPAEPVEAEAQFAG